MRFVYCLFCLFYVWCGIKLVIYDGGFLIVIELFIGFYGGFEYCDRGVCGCYVWRSVIVLILVFGCRV